MNLTQLDTPLQMLDTSYYDGRHEVSGQWLYEPIDWSQAKTRWKAVIIKQGQGLNIDPLFSLQFRAAEGHALRGIYHYFSSGHNAIASAHSAADAAESAGGYGELGVFLDLEKNPSNLDGATYLRNVASWLFEMEKRMGNFGSEAPLCIYTRASFWNPLFAQAGNPKWPAKYPVWAAGYPYDKRDDFEEKYQAVLSGQPVTDRPTMPKGFKTLLAWQWTEKGKPSDIPGYPPFKKSVDMNLLFFGLVTGPPEAPVPVPSLGEAAIRLDELLRLQALIEDYIKARREELS